jgi:hypothetical protein
MAERIVYGHVSGAQGTGYRIKARSADAFPGEDVKISELVQMLKIRPEDLCDRTGWYWLTMGPRLRIFGMVHVLRSEAGVQTLEYRFALLSHEECEKLAWQPFSLRDEMLSGRNWSLDGNTMRLRQLTVPHAPDPRVREGGSLAGFSVSWEIAGSCAAAMLEAHIDSTRVAGRRAIRFRAPDMLERGNPRVICSTSSDGRHDYSKPPHRLQMLWPLLTIAATLLIVPLVGILGFLIISLKEANSLARDRELALSKAEAFENQSVPITPATSAEAEPHDTKLQQDVMRAILNLFDTLSRDREYAPTTRGMLDSLRAELQIPEGSHDHLRRILSALDKWIAIERQRLWQDTSQGNQENVLHEPTDQPRPVREVPGQLDQRERSDWPDAPPGDAIECL